MKPIVIYVDKSRNEVRLTKKEFEKFLEDAYKQGWDSGYAEGKKYNYWPYWGSGTITSTYPPQDVTNTPYDPFKYNTTITCDTTKAVKTALGGEAFNSIGD